ncbi:MAG: HDIG domain-containing metalloprotein, partial [Chloroflexota bacterium]
MLVLVCTSILAFLALIQPWALRPDNLPLHAGDVAPQDMRAPRDVQYVSEVLTEQARAAAERAVAPVYGEPDLSIGRAQTDLLNLLLDQISAIRDSEAEITYEQKLIDLAALREPAISNASANLLLTLTPERWDLVSAEAVSLLGRTMRNPVRTEDLETVRQELPSLVSFSLSESEAGLVVELVSPLVAANSFYSPELTEAARQVARDAVGPVTQSYLEGQTIVLRGQLVTDVIFEALTQAGLVQPYDPLYEYIGAAALVVIMSLVTALYYFRRQVNLLSDLRGLLLQAGLFLLFLFAARIITPNRTLMPYLFPVPAFALLVAALFGLERGMIFGLLMGILAAYGMPDTLGLLPYYVLTSMCGVLAMGQARRVMQFIYAVIAIAGAGMAVVAAYRLAFTETDWVGIATLLGAAILYGIASSAIVLPLQYLLAQFLGVTTPMQLLEISRPDSPLLSYFLQRAPGTYQHSLQVANLAERAAERIGADALLTRIGALFHDIGKAINPLFFVENQPPSQIDSHDDVPPEESAADIIRHVADGLELARKYRLPRRLHDFISEHHGTLITRYQYNRAVEAAGGDASQVDESKFRYPGPPPRSKETALLMFADGVEARARAERPKDDEEMRALVRSVIESRQKDGQLVNAPLTQRDLTEVVESFVTTLRVTYHPRLEYPKEPAAADVHAQPREKSK